MGLYPAFVFYGVEQSVLCPASLWRVMYIIYRNRTISKGGIQNEGFADKRKNALRHILFGKDIENVEKAVKRLMEIEKKHKSGS